MRTVLLVLVLMSALAFLSTGRSAEQTAAGGPTTAGTAYRWVNEGGPYGGNVSCLALCAGSPDVLYAATSNGVFKSTDGAATWRPTAALRNDGRRAQVSDVAVNATDPDIVYAADGSLHKSTDGGASWTMLRPAGRGDGGANGVEVDPKKPNTLYVWNRSHGVYKSTDGGDTWELKSTGLFNSAFSSFELDPHFPATLYAVTWWRKSTYVSDDGGATWSESAGTIKNLTVKKLEKDPHNPRTFTLVLVHNDRELVYQSTNDGMSWGTRSENAWHFTPRQLSIDEDDPKSMSLSIREQNERDVYVTTDGAETWRLLEFPFKSEEFKAIRADSTHADIFYVATRRGVYYFSDDGGESWGFFYSAESDPDDEQTATIEELRTCFLYGLGVVEERFLVTGSTGSRMILHPSDPDIVYRADYWPAGVLKTVDFGKHWTAANEGLSAYPARGIACDSQTPGVVYTCSSNAVHKSTDGGKTWKETGLSKRLDWPLLAVHPLDPQIVLVARAYGPPLADISTDGGETWREIAEIAATRAEAFVFDSKDADIFYVLADSGILETTDRGRTWRSTGRSFKVSHNRMGGGPAATRQTSADIIYQVSETRALLRSTDVGRTWEEIKSLEGEGSYIPVHVHPVDPKMVFVEHDKQLHLSRDAGETWQMINIPGQWCFGMDPADPDVFYVGGRGILRTRDGGKTFEQLDNGLPSSAVVQIVVSPADGAVYAATDGAGVFHLEIEDETKLDKNEE